MKKFVFFLILLSLVFELKAENTWPFLDNKSMGSYDFILKNPEYDGRGTLIFILDCGADPAIPGLQKTSTGKTKFIDIQDFSNQLVLPLAKAENDTVNGAPVLKSSNTDGLAGWDNLELNPKDEKYYIGKLDENASFKNSGIKDINGNGKRNDLFQVLVFKIDNADKVLKGAPGIVKPDKEMWVYYIDQDADGAIDDEKPMFDYKYRFDTFNFDSGKKSSNPPFTFSANVEAGPKLVVNTCDGSHGSHCAGIAAGYKIYGTEGNDGVAPGAYLASLKIGNNILSGGATTCGSMKKAYEYGITFMKEAGFKNAVFSMSYGIGSETPGLSIIDKYLEKFAFEHPEVVICKSQGNSGPGINSTGNPSGADGVISVGAMIAPSTLKNLYGSNRKKDWVTHFSSRGGETAKPDIVAPAAASSTVPAFSRGDAFWGTSMSTPEVAGACAVLISAANRCNMKIDGQMIKKALKFSALPINGYTSVDYGNGLVNIPKAFEYLKILSERKEYDKVLGYKITTANSFMPNKSGTAAFWKAGGYFPSSGENQNVSVRAIFPKHISKTEQEQFYRVFKLKSNASWLETDKSEIYIRGSIPQKFSLIYDEDKLDKPGLYVGRISAYAQNEDNGGFADFDVQATVVIPYRFNTENNHELNFKNKSLDIGDIERLFIEVPPSASAMNIKMKPAGNKWYSTGLYLFSPDGNNFDRGFSKDNTDRKPIEIQAAEKELLKGVWELMPYCHYQSAKSSFFDLEIKFYGVSCEPEIIGELESPIGSKPSGKARLFNEFESVQATYGGAIEGYKKEEEHEMRNSESFSMPIKIGEAIEGVALKIEMDVEDFNKLTDCAVLIKNSAGKVVRASGLERKQGSLYLNAGAGNYTLEIVPGFATTAEKTSGLDLSITEKYYYKDDIDINITKAPPTLIPGIPYNLEFELGDNLLKAPDSCLTFGFIELRDKNNGNLVKVIEVEVE